MDDDDSVYLVITHRDNTVERFIMSPYNAMLELYDPLDDWASARILADDVDMGKWDRTP